MRDLHEPCEAIGPVGHRRQMARGRRVGGALMLAGLVLAIVACESHGGVPVALGTTSLPDATVGAAYQVTLKASGGRAPWMTSGHLPYHWYVDNLPKGLALHGDKISGTPGQANAGTYYVSVEVTVTAHRRRPGRDARRPRASRPCQREAADGGPLPAGQSGWNGGITCYVLLHLSSTTPAAKPACTDAAMQADMPTTGDRVEINGQDCSGDWAVAYATNIPGDYEFNIALHWTGTRWEIIDRGIGCDSNLFPRPLHPPACEAD